MEVSIALQSLIAMLNHMSLVPGDRADLQTQRVKFINSCRNRLVHGGDLPLPDWLDDQGDARSVSIWFAGHFPPALVEGCINDFLRITGCNWPTEHKSCLREFPFDGTWDGREPAPLSFSTPHRFGAADSSQRRVADDLLIELPKPGPWGGNALPAE